MNHTITLLPPQLPKPPVPSSPVPSNRRLLPSSPIPKPASASAPSSIWPTPAWPSIAASPTPPPSPMAPSPVSSPSSRNHPHPGARKTTPATATTPSPSSPTPCPTSRNTRTLAHEPLNAIEGPWTYINVLASIRLQGQGLGTALMHHAIAEADRDGLPMGLMTDTLRNVRFYERLGFTTVSRPPPMPP